MEEVKVNQMAPLVWAYIGDSVYEQHIRNYLVITTMFKPHKLHIEATKYVKASAQALILKEIEKELTDKEKEIVRRTRNTRNHHLPKNSNVQEYMYSTAFEGLIGYLYLIKNFERLDKILGLSIKIINLSLNKSE